MFKLPSLLQSLIKKFPIFNKSLATFNFTDANGLKEISECIDSLLSLQDPTLESWVTLFYWCVDRILLYQRGSEAPVRRYFLKYAFLNILQNSQESTCVGVTFNKVSGLGPGNVQVSLKKLLKKSKFR